MQQKCSKKMKPLMNYTIYISQKKEPFLKRPLIKKNLSNKNTIFGNIIRYEFY